VVLGPFAGRPPPCPPEPPGRDPPAFLPPLPALPAIHASLVVSIDRLQERSRCGKHSLRRSAMSKTRSVLPSSCRTVCDMTGAHRWTRSAPTVPVGGRSSYSSLRVYLSSTAFHSGTLPKLR